MKERKKLRWERLDNAALIFPASHRKNWSNVFRISFSLNDDIDSEVLQQAVNNLAPRFPTVCACLRRGSFWYYLEEVKTPPTVRVDSYQPVMYMSREEFSKCAIRVLYYRNRIAVEFFHVVTDGTGGMVFAKTLAAEYIKLYYGCKIPCIHGIKDINTDVAQSELEDDFKKYKGPISAPRDPLDVYHPIDKVESGRYLHDTIGIIDSDKLVNECKQSGVTVTSYLTALLLECLIEMQEEDIRKPKKRKKVKVQVPVNLRQLYKSETMRNFVAVANIGVDPKLGHYTFDELVRIVYLQMQLMITEKNMQTIFTTNVAAEQNPIIRVMPLPLKNLVMRIVFDRVGESVACLSISNLGNVKLPEEMQKYVQRIEFVIGAQASGSYNCGVVSYDGKAYINLVRTTEKARLEQKFFTKLVRRGFHVRIETNENED